MFVENNYIYVYYFSEARLCEKFLDLRRAADSVVEVTKHGGVSLLGVRGRVELLLEVEFVVLAEEALVDALALRVLLVLREGVAEDVGLHAHVQERPVFSLIPRVPGRNEEMERWTSETDAD